MPRTAVLESDRGGTPIMMRYATDRRYGAMLPRPRNRYDGYQYSLFPAPVALAQRAPDEPRSFRAVAPRLRPLVARYNSRCPECAGPLVSGEGAVACPICGFRRL